MMNTIISNMNYMAIISILCTWEEVNVLIIRNDFSDKNHDFCISACSNYHTYKVEVLHYRHAIHIVVITMYDIIKFYIDIVYWMI